MASRGPCFGVRESASATADLIHDLLAKATTQWPGIIDGDARSRLTDEHLTTCVQAIASHSICDTNFEVLDGFFEYLVSRVAKGAKGQYFTPRQVVECCVRIVNPTPDETVLDPACGSAGFLLHVANHNAGRLNTSAQQYCAAKLWGCDFDKRAIQVAKALMLVAGNDRANLHQVNSLAVANTNDLLDIAANGTPRLTIEDLMRSKTRRFRGFDVILTNPPFAGEIREPALLDCYDMAKRNRRMERDVLFLERCVRLLKPGGRLGIVLPHNKFGGTSWAYSTEFFVLESIDDASIAFLVPFLLSAPVQAVLSAAQEGGHHPRFNERTLTTLPIPTSLAKQANELSACVEQAVTQAREAYAALQCTVATAGRLQP